MPAGGSWTTQNKIRPGAYINFVSVPKPIGVLGERGVVAVALPMIWGPQNELIEVYSSDLIDGSSLSKIGCTAFDTEISLPYRMALTGSYKAFFFRSDTGGTKATNATLTPLTVNAKYAGTVGNSIGIEIVKDTIELEATQTYTVRVLYDEIVKEEYVITTLGELELVESEWVEFTVTDSSENTAPTPTAGIILTGGTNGEVDEETYPTFFELLKRQNWQCMAIQTTDATIPPLVKDFIELCREDLGKKAQAVCYNYNTDYEGIIKTSQGFKTATDTVSPELFQLYAASITAGAAVDESNTCRVVEDAIDIINYYDDKEIEEKLQEGWFILSERQDGVILIEQDINSLHTFTTDKNKAFSKNRVIRTLDEIGNTAALIFNRNYAGKVDNNDNGRNLYKGELINLCSQLQDLGALQNFNGADDITIMQGTDVDAVVCEFTIQPVDSMEKLYMTVNVDA